MDYSHTVRLSAITFQLDLLGDVLSRLSREVDAETWAAEAERVCDLCESLQVTAEIDDLPDGMRERLTWLRQSFSQLAHR